MTEMTHATETVVDQAEPDTFESELLEQDSSSTLKIGLADFVSEFGESLLSAVGEQNPPVYEGVPNARREQILSRLSRQAFPAQREVVQACAKLLVDLDEPAVVINGEMGTGKTMMSIALAAAMHEEGYCRALVVCPPHLVYKWRREIKSTIPNASVWILNGPDCLRKLLELRAMLSPPKNPTFFVMGRVRMRMGFDWRPAFAVRHQLIGEIGSIRACLPMAECSQCGEPVTETESDGNQRQLTREEAAVYLNRRQMACVKCHGPLWTLKRGDAPVKSSEEVLVDALQKIPTIGEKTAARLVQKFGARKLAAMLEDNVHEFINLMDDEGELYFTDRQARRMDRAMANQEFSFGSGGYQPSEFVKRYLPRNYFGILIGDEGHEFKNEGSAQGQAFGVLASQCRKAVLLTGTLMGGYADDLFYLLWRLNPTMMIEDGFKAVRGSLGPAGLAFLREHGVIKDIYREISSEEAVAYRTAKGKAKVSHRTAKAPGFGPQGIMRFVLPITAFLRLRDIGGTVLPPYVERLQSVEMTSEQQEAYGALSSRLTQELRQALRKGDKTLMGVVLNVLLAWPDCAFRSELVEHPRTRQILASVPSLFKDMDFAPKEAELLAICKAAKQRGRRVLAYSVYTGTRDTTARLKALLEREGLKVAVLRSSVDAAKREDWLMDKVDQGVDVVITNPELVKTGLDMLEFPTIVFMQTGYNVYTLQQASRRSWRIGQRVDVEVIFLAYGGTAQMTCLELMAKKITVSQSTSGEMPESGLDVLNQSGDSLEVALAKRLVN